MSLELWNSSSQVARACYPRGRKRSMCDAPDEFIGRPSLEKLFRFVFDEARTGQDSEHSREITSEFATRAVLPYLRASRRRIVENFGAFGKDVFCVSDTMLAIEACLGYFAA